MLIMMEIYHFNMLRGFETITADLNAQELELMPTIIKGLKTKHGKDMAVTGGKIADAVGLSGIKVQKIINVIRVKNLIPGLCACGKGYFIANNIEELDNYIISLKQRIKAQVDVLNALEQQTIIFGGTGQTTLFE